VSGEAESQHLWAAAADFIGDLDAIEDGLRRQGLIVIRTRTHVHAQAWPKGVARRVGLIGRLGLG